METSLSLSASAVTEYWWHTAKPVPLTSGLVNVTSLLCGDGITRGLAFSSGRATIGCPTDEGQVTASSGTLFQGTALTTSVLCFVPMTCGGGTRSKFLSRQEESGTVV